MSGREPTSDRGRRRAAARELDNEKAIGVKCSTSADPDHQLISAVIAGRERLRASGATFVDGTLTERLTRMGLSVPE